MCHIAFAFAGVRVSNEGRFTNKPDETIYHAKRDSESEQRGNSG